MAKGRRESRRGGAAHAMVATPLCAIMIVLAVTRPSAAQTRPASQMHVDPMRVDPKRVEQIAGMLREGTFAFGPAAGNRAAWETLAQKPAFAGIVAKAEPLIDRPIPDTTDDLYLDFSRTGNRDHYQDVYFDRTGRLLTLILAEGVEHKRRFIPTIEKLIRAICDQKTWILPAHDGGLKNFHSEEIYIDLFSSGMAGNLSTTVWLLGDELSDDVKALIAENVRRRVLDPFADMMHGRRPMMNWLTIENNWNAVCLCNVTAAAMASLPAREDRALYLAAAEKYSESYLSGYDPDGYCVEGLGYWNYGYINYIRLSELAWQCTDGKLNLFDRPKVRSIASFSARFELAPGVYPSFGDASPTQTPTAALAAFGARKFDLPYDSPALDKGFLSNGGGGGISEAMMFSCPSSAGKFTTKSTTKTPLSDWFDDANVLICRPRETSGQSLAVAIKAGHNGVSHGHDDLGSFVLTVGKTVLLTDPGGEVYTKRTFSANRYQSNVLNSFGHSVPIVDDVLQGHTAKAAAKTVSRNLTDAADTITLDLTHAYPTDALKSLTRKFTYDRETAELSIDDEVHFRPGKSHRFGLTFITLSRFKQISPTQIQISDKNAAIQIDLKSDTPLTITSEEINEDVHTATKPGRISVTTDASPDASIHTTIDPLMRAKP